MVNIHDSTLADAAIFSPLLLHDIPHTSVLSMQHIHALLEPGSAHSCLLSWGGHD